jgi:hypothetical protein
MVQIYCHTLFLGEALREELRPHGVDVVTVCPGPTRTEFEAVANMKFGSGALDPAAVVTAALSNLGRRSSVVVGVGNKLSAFAPRLLPRTAATRIVGRFVTAHAAEG